MTELEFLRIARRTGRLLDLWLTVFYIAAVLYIVGSVLPAFLPGGPAYRLIHGGRQ